MLEEDLSYLRQNLPQNSMAFGFEDAVKGQAVMGYYITLPTRAEQLAFDGVMQETLDYLAASLGATGKSKPIRVKPDLGEARLASTFVSNQSGFETRLDMLLFRRGEVSAILFVFYPDGDKPVVGIIDLAHLLDGRIQGMYEATPSADGNANIYTWQQGI